MYTFKTHIGKLEHLLGVNYLYIPAEVLEKLGGIKSGRYVCHLSGIKPFQCGFVSLGDGTAYITVNKARMKQLKLQTGDPVTVGLEKDNSQFGMDMSEVLEALLSQDDEGMARFMKLTPGMQRYIIYYVAQVKNPQLRIDRALLLIGNLKQIAEGKETFRALLGKD